MKQTSSPFRGRALSGFCMQAALLYQSAVPLYEGLAVMAEDAASEEEQNILTGMADKVRMGLPFSAAVKESGCFPSYMEEMVVLGEQTGTLDVTLKGLSGHYEKETDLAQGLKRALTWPTMMICMLFLILFVLFVKVMPIFSDVYEQLGARIPDVTRVAIRIGGFASGLALAVMILLAASVLFLRLMGRSGKNSAFVESILNRLKSRSEISHMSALRRVCGTMSVSLRCGLPMEDGLEMAERLAGEPRVAGQVKETRTSVADGKSFYDAAKDSGLFTGFDLQLIRVASRAGQLDSILEKLADDYSEKTDDALDAMTARLEPAVVTVLAAAVGLVLLSVMLPLVGILSAIG